MVDRDSDEMIHALADGTRERLRRSVRIADDARKARFRRMVDVEAICLDWNRQPPKRILWVLRCPECGGKLDKDKIKAVDCVGHVTHRHYACVDCKYEWAKGDSVLEAANRGHVKEIIPPPKDTKAVR